MVKQLMAFMIANVIAASVSAERVDMKQAGAKADGKTLNTELINTTLSRLSREGGGTLYFPSGTYLTGSIRMQSNTTLELEKGATLLFSTNFDDYLPFVEVRHEGVMMKSFAPLIYAVDAENITIKGAGILDGQGKAWWDEFFKVLIDLRDNGVRDVNRYQPMWDKANDMKAIKAETNADWHKTADRRFFRPPFIHPIRCKNVRIEGVSIKNSPFWTVNPELCDKVVVKNVSINNEPSPNTDGINPESCSDVTITGCNISVGDDCITIKSGRDLQARKIGKPCENIVIKNCAMRNGHGGVVIGSEMSGGVRKVRISNCTFSGTDRGIRLKSTRGRGGVVEDIVVKNIVMDNIRKEALIFNLKYSRMPKEEKSDRTPVFRDIKISNVVVNGTVMPIEIVGLEESPITDIKLSNIIINDAKKKCLFEDCANIKMNHVTVNGEAVSDIQ